jgi:CheY-like chemotaxis protein
MTRVLLITDTERVQRIFHALEVEGALQLRIAATLTQGDLEISASAPELTFVQSRISGISGDIVLRHLNKLLPKNAKIILLAGDAEDEAQAKKLARPFVDISLDDEALAEAVRNVLSGRRAAPKKATTAPAAPASKVPHPQVKDYLPVSTFFLEKPGQKEPVSAEQGAEVPERDAEKASAQEPCPDSPERCTGKAGAGSFDEVMRRASAGGSSSIFRPLDPEQDHVDIGKPGPTSVEAAEQSARLDREGNAGPVSIDDYFRGEPLADAMLRAHKKKRPKWILPLVLVLLFGPLFFYIATNKTAPPHPSTAPGNLPPAAKPAATPKAKPEARQAAKPEASPIAKPAPGAAKPAVKPGLKVLPPFLAYAKLDAAYGKTHPGWLRYLGKKTEYKLFREADLYRAIQVIALDGGTISDQLVETVLLEFGGINSYRVESTVAKGDYIVEHGVAKGGVTLTVYRKKKNHGMKGLVLYYR